MRNRLVLTALCAGLAACAAPPTGSPVSAGKDGQCFLASQVQNFREGDDRSLYLRASRTEVFEAQVAGACLDLGSALSIAIQPELGASNRLCAGDWATVQLSGGSARPSTCRVRVARRLTPEQVEALPSRSRP